MKNNKFQNCTLHPVQYMWWRPKRVTCVPVKAGRDDAKLVTNSHCHTKCILVILYWVKDSESPWMRKDFKLLFFISKESTGLISIILKNKSEHAPQHHWWSTVLDLRLPWIQSDKLQFHKAHRHLPLDPVEFVTHVELSHDNFESESLTLW